MLDSQKEEIFKIIQSKENDWHYKLISKLEDICEYEYDRGYREGYEAAIRDAKR